MLQKEKASVKDFYDNFGWITDTDGNYRDTTSFADIRPVLSSYSHDTQMRVPRFFKPSGQYFLDAGSGPLSEPEYIRYSAGYVHRVCLDLSERALKEARDKAGSHGLYVMADVSNLPFREGTFDAVLISHVLYHIPKDEQANTLRQLYSAMKDGGTCLIDSYFVVASKGGAPQHPGWYRNILANPEVEVQVGTTKLKACARTATSEERVRRWEKALEFWPPYADYQRKTEREIPVVVLDPVR